MTNPQELLDDLKTNASLRKKKSLDLIFKLLQHHTTAGNRDFSIATIGRLSAEAGGPSPQSIRNKGGEDYRRLIEGWAALNGTTTKKPLSAGGHNTTPKRDNDVLSLIEDPALRAVVGAIIAERDLFRKELRTLKCLTELTIDRRSEKHIHGNSVELLPAIVGILTDCEREALAHATSNKLFDVYGWVASENGRVKDHNGRHIYKPGYLTAIEKVIRLSHS